MSRMREDANCFICSYKSTCRKALDKEHDENGKPLVACYGYSKEVTEEELVGDSDDRA